MKRNNVNMLSGSVFKGLLSMTIPIMIMNVMQTMVNVIDMTILGNFANDTAVGAVGACGTLITLCTTLLIGVSSGANIVIAEHVGKGDRENAEKAVGCAVLFALVGGLALAIIGFSCAKTFLQWTNCPQKLFEQSVTYFKLYFIGVPVIMLYSFGASILRSIGDTKHPMFFLAISGVIKILLTFFLCGVMNMNVEGAAIATIVANVISSSLCIITLIRSNSMAHLNYKKLKFYASELKQMLFVGVPTGLQGGLYSFANTVIATAVNGFGADATTGLSIANQFDGILYQIINAPSLATIPYVAQNIGASNIKRAKEAIGKSIIITVAFGASIGSLSAIFSAQLSSIMSSTPAVIMYSCQKMVIVSSTYFICGINDVLAGSLRGFGRPMVPTVAALMFMCILRFFWVRFVFPIQPSLTLLYLVWPVGWILCIITELIVLIPTISKTQKKINAI